MDWVNRREFPSKLNEINLILILKCENPVTMKDPRPISLCNVIYKILAKAPANRLKLVLPDLSLPSSLVTQFRIMF